jgi:hypothetical protein
MQTAKSKPRNSFASAPDQPLLPISSIAYLSLLFYLSLIHPLPNPASSLADRAPPYGGIARPKGKDSRHKGGSVCPR